MLKTLTAIALILCLICGTALAQPLEQGVPLELKSPSVVLTEAAAGTVVFEKDADSPRQVASLTKLMTLLLVFEELEAGRLNPDAKITVSKFAAGQPGSNALLDAGASYTVKELVKCTIVSSANDAACALAETLSGTEEAFVARMNERARELGLTNTVYVNCTGLPKEGQQTTARDVAALSCAISAHEGYHEYASIWMDTLTHPSGRVTELTNTNRLVRFYEGCDGFKTGSTDAAKYCLSATCQKDGLRLIAVVLGAPTSQQRFDDARAMLDYGFAGYKRVTICQAGQRLQQTVTVTRGAKELVEVAVGKGVSMLMRLGDEKRLTMEVELPQSVSAPIEKGQTLGVVHIMLDGRVVSKVPAVAVSEVRMPSLLEGFIRIGENWR